jgi:hypothetical protein
VTLGEDGSASAQIRSDGTGSADVKASGPPFESAATTVEFNRPWRFLVATFLGAVLGWIVKTGARARSMRSIVVALASAAILSAAYAIGIRWLQWAPEAGVGEALGFFVGAMGAYFGMRVLGSAK